MAIADIVKATEAGKVDWRVHDNSIGWWAVIDNVFRLDLVEGVFTLMKQGVKLETAADDGTLEKAVEAYIESTKSLALDEFFGKLTADPTVEAVDIRAIEPETVEA